MREGNKLDRTAGEVTSLEGQLARKAATTARLVLLAVILNSSETSGPLSNGRTLKMYS